MPRIFDHDLKLINMLSLLSYRDTFPEEITSLADNLKKLKDKVFFTKLRSDWKDKSDAIEFIFEAQAILSSVITGFLSLYKISAEKIGEKDDFSFKRLESDLISNLNKIDEVLNNNLVQKTPQEIYISNILQCINSITYLPNALIVPPLFFAYEKIKDKNYVRIKAEKIKGANLQEFYTAFFEEVKRRVGLTPILRVFKAPRTVSIPMLTPKDKQQLVVGIMEELKKGLGEEEAEAKEKTEEATEEESKEIEKAEEESEKETDEE